MININGLTQEQVELIWSKIYPQITSDNLDFFDDLPEGSFADFGGKRKTKRKKRKRKSIKR